MRAASSIWGLTAEIAEDEPAKAIGRKRVMIAATGIVATITGNAVNAPSPMSPRAGNLGRMMPIAFHDNAPPSTTSSRIRPI